MKTAIGHGKGHSWWGGKIHMWQRQSLSNASGMWTQLRALHNMVCIIQWRHTLPQHWKFTSLTSINWGIAPYGASRSYWMSFTSMQCWCLLCCFYSFCSETCVYVGMDSLCGHVFKQFCLDWHIISPICGEWWWHFSWLRCTVMHHDAPWCTAWVIVHASEVSIM
jgi:hypothetical protein